jgi:hypothetical protein
MASDIVIVDAPTEKRQIARTLVFEPRLAPYIAWDNIAREARELGANFEARTTKDGAVTVLMFWAYSADEVA